MVVAGLIVQPQSAGVAQHLAPARGRRQCRAGGARHAMGGTANLHVTLTLAPAASMACASASTSMALNGAVWLRVEILAISFLICHSEGGYVLMPAGSGHASKTAKTGR